jgi:adenylate kinase
MAKIVIVAGLSGAGKTTLLEKPATSKGYRTAALWLLMKDEAAKRGIKAGHDTLKRLDNTRMSVLRSAAFKRVSKMNGNVIVDTHLSIEQANGFLPGLPRNAMKELKKVVGIIYINASSQEITKRRRKDKMMREREDQSASSLDMQRAIDLSTLAYYATELNIPCYVIHNREGHQDIAAKELRSALRNAFGG